MESQTGVSHLPRAGTESAHQAQEANRAGEARTLGGARGHQSMLVHGFHARPVIRWP